MADAIFDKDGKITNLDDLTAGEVAEAYQVKNKTIHDARVAESEKARIAREEAEQAKKDLETERAKNVRPPEEKPVPPSSDPDELKLIARGLSDEEIDQAKIIAKGNGVSLLEAIKNPLFVLFQSNLKEEQKREKAKLGASSGSGQGQDDTGITVKPGTTVDEHKDIWKKAKEGMGR